MLKETKDNVVAWRCARTIPSRGPEHAFILLFKSLSSNMAPIRILIINPNSTASMTDALRPLVEALDFKDVNGLGLPCTDDQA
jgi:hypothetical protein